MESGCYSKARSASTRRTNGSGIFSPTLSRSVNARFNGEVESLELDEPSHAKLRAHGTANGNAADAVSEMRLSDDPDGQIHSGVAMGIGNGETISPLNEMGVKSAGEAGAIEDALQGTGVEILEILLNSNRLWELMQNSQTKNLTRDELR